MNRNLRSAIRDDILSDFELPRADFAFRVLRAIPDARFEHGSPGPRAQPPARVVFQTLAVVVAAVIVAVVMIAVRTARGDIALPAGLPFGLGGLHPPAANYFIPDAQFVSADNAWIVAQLHVHNGPTVVMATTDGGQSWHEQFRIPDSNGYGGIKFWNAQDGELTELVPSTLPPSKTPGAPGSSNMIPRIYRTSDGGTHWQLVDQPVDWMGIMGQAFFRTEQEGWRILPVFQTGKSGPTSSALQHSTDAGATWTTIGTIPAGAGVNSQLTFTDGQTGWLTADSTQSYVSGANGKLIPSQPPVAPLWVTRDGGQTWAPIQLTLPAGVPGNGVQALTPIFFGNEGVLEVLMEVKPGSTGVFIATTHDNGQHWSTPVRAPGAQQGGGAMFLAPQHWLVSSGPRLSETIDAGKTWTTRQVLADGLSLDLAPWNYIDGKTVWTQVGPDRMVRSTDGGANWQSVVPPTINS